MSIFQKYLLILKCLVILIICFTTHVTSAEPTNEFEASVIETLSEYRDTGIPLTDSVLQKIILGFAGKLEKAEGNDIKEILFNDAYRLFVYYLQELHLVGPHRALVDAMPKNSASTPLSNQTQNILDLGKARLWLAHGNYIAAEEIYFRLEQDMDLEGLNLTKEFYLEYALLKKIYGDTKKAKQYFEKSVNIKISSGTISAVSHINALLGLAEIAMNEDDSILARKYCDEALEIMSMRKDYSRLFQSLRPYALLTKAMIYLDAYETENISDTLDEIVQAIENKQYVSNANGLVVQIISLIHERMTLEDAKGFLKRLHAAISSNYPESFYLVGVKEADLYIKSVEFDYTKAIEIIDEIDRIKKAYFAPSHSLHLVGLKHYESLVSGLERSQIFEIRADVYDYFDLVSSGDGPISYLTSATLFYLASLELNLGNDGIALEHAIESINGFVDLVGANAPLLVDNYRQLHAVHTVLNDDKQAAASLKKAEKLMIDNGLEKHWTYAQILLDMSSLEGDSTLYETALLKLFALLTTGKKVSLVQRVELAERLMKNAIRSKIDASSVIFYLEKIESELEAKKDPNILLQMRIRSSLADYYQYELISLKSSATALLLQSRFELPEDYDYSASVNAERDELLERLVGYYVSNVEDSIIVYGSGSLQVANSLKNLADLYEVITNSEYAVELHEKILERYAHSSLITSAHVVASSYISIGLIYARRHLYAKALEYFHGAERFLTKAKGTEKIQKHLHEDLADTYFQLGNYSKAYQYYSKLQIPVESRSIEYWDLAGGYFTIPKRQYSNIVQAGYKFYQSIVDKELKHAVSDENFKNAQLLLKSSVGNALLAHAEQEMISSEDSAQSNLVVELQKIKEKRRDLSRDIVSGFYLEQSEDVPNLRFARDSLTQEIIKLDIERENLESEISIKYPEYVSLTESSTVSLEQVQAVIDEDEAVLVFAELPLETNRTSVLWSITKESIDWTEFVGGGGPLYNWVRGLRCGLDPSDEYITETFACNKLKYHCDRYLGKDDAHLPFCFKDSHDLYENLFGSIKQQIHGKKLIIHTNGALTQLPFETLVTKLPAEKFGIFPNYKKADEYQPYRSARWLIDDHEIAYAVSMSSFVQSRKTIKEKKDALTFFSVSNPLLEGNQNHPVIGSAQRAAAAEADRYHSCENVDDKNSGFFTRIAALFNRGDNVVLTDSGRVSPQFLKSMSPLPDTAIEACLIRDYLQSDSESVFLGRNATESKIKEMSRNNKLLQYDIVHFGTHTLIPNERDQLEPGLVLTPPNTPSIEDDGYLSFSEIADLKLDADLVILSACNTAVGDSSNETLAGFAKSFFYAKAQSIMLSHWPVASDAAFDVVSRTLEEFSTGSESYRSSLRKAILKTKAEGGRKSHPSYWGAFTLVNG